MGYLINQVWRFENYKAYGLNVGRNFLHGDYELSYEDQDEMYECCAEMLNDWECENCAIFLRYLDGNMEAMVKAEEAINIYAAENINDLDFFSDIDTDYRPCCYSLLVESEPGKWRVIEK